MIFRKIHNEGYFTFLNDHKIHVFLVPIQIECMNV